MYGKLLQNLTLVSAALAFTLAAQASTKYNLDTAHSSITFKVDHLVVSSVTGRFDKFDGTFMFDEKTGELADLNAKIDIDSINTNEAKRDAHLKNPEFFGARTEKNKLVEAKRWMTFKSTKVDKRGLKPTQVTGDLTMNGITKPVTLDVNYKGSVKDPWGNTKLGFEATGKLNRKDFGLTWNKALETGGVVVGEEVAINITGEAAPLAPAETATKKK